MHGKTIIICALAGLFLSAQIGCTTTDGSSGGWVVVGQPDSPPPPPKKQPPPPKYKKDNRGQKKAASNHMRSAYRFLQKGKPEHAMRELEKARSKMGQNFWFHYYMGGAYYFQGMYVLAGDSWKMAYRYTNDHRFRSRLRTCQAYAINYRKGDEPSTGFLRMAIDVDRDNRHARELLRDLGDSMQVPDDKGQRAQVGFMRPSGSGAGEGGSHEDGKGPDQDDDDDDRNGRSKGKKGRDKDDKGHGKSGKKKEKYKKIRDKERFTAYFMIEMP